MKYDNQNPASNLFEQVKILENAGLLISSPARRDGVFQPLVVSKSNYLPKENSPIGKKEYIHNKICVYSLDCRMELILDLNEKPLSPYNPNTHREGLLSIVQISGSSLIE